MSPYTTPRLPSVSVAKPGRESAGWSLRASSLRDNADRLGVIGADLIPWPRFRPPYRAFARHGTNVATGTGFRMRTAATHVAALRRKRHPAAAGNAAAGGA